MLFHLVIILVVVALFALTSHSLLLSPSFLMRFEAKSRIGGHTYRGIIRFCGNNIEGFSAFTSEDVVFSLRNGRAYLHTSVEGKCSQTEVQGMPLVREIVQVLDQAVLVWDATNVTNTQDMFYDIEVQKCAKQGFSAWHVAIDENDYIICGKSSGNYIYPSRIVHPEFILEFTGPATYADISSQFARLDGKCGSLSTFDHSTVRNPSFNTGPNKIFKPWFFDYQKSCTLDWHRSLACAQLDTNFLIPKKKRLCILTWSRH
jgi:hypothetical protein